MAIRRVHSKECNLLSNSTSPLTIQSNPIQSIAMQCNAMYYYITLLTLLCEIVDVLKFMGNAFSLLNIRWIGFIGWSMFFSLFNWNCSVVPIACHSHLFNMYNVEWYYWTTFYYTWATLFITSLHVHMYAQCIC